MEPQASHEICVSRLSIVGVGEDSTPEVARRTGRNEEAVFIFAVYRYCTVLR